MIVGASENAWMRLNPQHPGGLLKRGYLDAFEDYPGMTVGAAAEKIGVSRVNLSRVLNERGPITLDLAMKLEAVGWGTADSWLGKQLKFDIAQARKRLNRPLAEAPVVREVKRLKAESGAPEVVRVEQKVHAEPASAAAA